MKTSDFDYELPDELIAQKPLPERSDSRMLILHRKSGSIEHSTVNNLPDYLAPNDLLVLNDTKVIPVRIHGYKQDTEGKIELLLLEDLGNNEWSALCKASRRPQIGTVLLLAGDQLQGKVIWVGDQGEIRIRFQDESSVLQVLYNDGETPLPPYIERKQQITSQLVDSDKERYQTVFARFPGAVAAPTAGLHFSEALFSRLHK